MEISNRQLVLITLIILATAPVDAARRLARWAKSTGRSRSGASAIRTTVDV